MLGLRVGLDADLAGDRRKASVQGPKWQIGMHCGCEEMHVDPSEASAHEALSLDECKNVRVFDNMGVGQRGKRTKNLPSPLEVTASEFPDNEGMTPHSRSFQQS